MNRFICMICLVCVAAMASAESELSKVKSSPVSQPQIMHKKKEENNTNEKKNRSRQLEDEYDPDTGR